MFRETLSLPAVVKHGTLCHAKRHDAGLVVNAARIAEEAADRFDI